MLTQRSVEGGRPGRPDGTEHGRRPVVPLRRRHRPAPRPPGLVPNALLPRAEEPSSAHQERRGGWLDPKSLSARRTPVAPPLEMVPRQRPAGYPEVGSKSLLVTWMSKVSTEAHNRAEDLARPHAARP